MNCECGAKAEYVLLDYGYAKPMCRACLNELCHLEGEVNLDFFHLEIGLPGFIKRVDEILKYHESRYLDLLEKYSELRKRMKEASP